MRDRALGSTVRLKFTTTDNSTGAPVAPSSAFVASDFRIYKDGSASEKATTNGITVTSPFDSVVGRHLIEIDTSNSTGDSGFWASGSAYFVELNTAKTVNSQPVSGLEIGSFSLELQTADVRKFGGTNGTFASGRPEVSNVVGTVSGAVGSVDGNVGGNVVGTVGGIDGTLQTFDAIWTKIKNWLSLIMGKTADATTLAEINATTAGASFNNVTDSTEAIRDRGDAAWVTGSSGTGTGARTVTVTVNDGTTALQNAKVRLSEGANTFVGTTNASGVVTFNLDDATYTVAITKSGYSYAGTTLVVDGTEAVTYSMTATSIPSPSSPDKTVLTILCLDSEGDAASGVSISIRYTAIPTGSEDIALPGGSITKTSNGSGIASFEVIKGATIEYKRGTRDVWTEAVMSDEDTTSITSFIGTP